jgi:outer membrane protein insertion porin family
LSGRVVEVVVEGHETIPTDQVLAKLRTRAGREFDERVLEDDVARLVQARWFADVRPFVRRDPERDGLVVTFRVVELPMVRSVEYRGMTKLKKKEVEEATDLKPGSRAEPVKAGLAAEQIRRMYQDKGYAWAEVRLIRGGAAEDRDIVFEIFEGPKSRLRSIRFTGNRYVSAAVLRTKLSSKAAILGVVGGTYHKEDIEEDARRLREYYHSQGFFEVNIRPIVRPDPNMGDMDVEFVVWEGTQYKVRQIEFEGNKYLTDEQLREGLVLHSGQPFRDDLREADLKTLQGRYGSVGFIDAQIQVERRYADPERAPGVVDLVYRIEEGAPYRLGRLIVQGNSRTRDEVVRREANMAGLVPGEPIDQERIEKFRQRLGNLRYFATTPDMGKPIAVKVVNRRPPDQPYGSTIAPNLDEVIRARLQGPDETSQVRLQSPGFDDEVTLGGAAGGVDRGAAGNDGEVRSGRPTRSREVGEPLAGDSGPARVAQMDGPRWFDPPVDEPLEAPPLEVLPTPIEGNGPRRGEGTRTPPFGQDVAPGGFPSTPGGNMTNVGPDRQEPFPERSFADIITQVDEVATGRLMFGIGASSFGGFSGNFIFHETNFDLFNLPRNLRDFGEGRAFRGRGQEFRLELSPGTAINRMVVSFRDPYVFNLPIGFGTSGYLFSRFYPDWNEDRMGGRFSLGRQFGTQTYADVAFRIEDVDFYGFKYPAPAEYLAASGHTTLATIRPSLRFDNRNDPFAPNRGYYLEFAFEQGWGDFTFPKVTAEGRVHFTTGSRPDGSGKRVLTLRGFVGATGRDTPVYERFFAGDFRSMRGFAYRGVGPFLYNSNLGGLFTTVGSLEWQFPWTANDKLQQVIFTDFGTVESDYAIHDFRVAVGTGLRVYLPQQLFGPLPLAFDIAFPVVKTAEDRERIFTFFIGSFW